LRAGCAARAVGTLSRGEGSGPRAAQAGLPNPWPGRRTGVVRGSWAVLSGSGGAAGGQPRPVLTISLSKTARARRSFRPADWDREPTASRPTILLSDTWGRRGWFTPPRQPRRPPVWPFKDPEPGRGRIGAGTGGGAGARRRPVAPPAPKVIPARRGAAASSAGARQKGAAADAEWPAIAAPSPSRTRGTPRPCSPDRTPRAGSWRWCPARDVATAPAMTLDCWPRADGMVVAGERPVAGVIAGAFGPVVTG
jgi:hypothetical protein